MHHAYMHLLLQAFHGCWNANDIMLLRALSSLCNTACCYVCIHVLASRHLVCKDSCKGEVLSSVCHHCPCWHWALGLPNSQQHSAINIYIYTPHIHVMLRVMKSRGIWIALSAGPLHILSGQSSIGSSIFVRETAAYIACKPLTSACFCMLCIPPALEVLRLWSLSSGRMLRLT